jgi:hypothetical protein
VRGRKECEEERTGRSKCEAGKREQLTKIESRKGGETSEKNQINAGNSLKQVNLGETT